MDLSIIIPFCNEWPQVAFTIRAVAEQLIEWHDFEIIAVDNYVDCPQTNEPDRGHDHKNKRGEPVESHIKTVSKFHEWLKYVRYDKTLSHWQAKNEGVKHSTGRFILFLDAHVTPSQNGLLNMFTFWRDNHKDYNGTLNLPLTYHILEKQRLVYQLDVDPDTAYYHYKFRNYNDGLAKYTFGGVFEVPVMSLCGMLMSREIFEMLGGFPATLGIYGGGENFVNFCFSRMGISRWIYPGGTLYHHGDTRGYSFQYDDYHKNRMTAVYFHSGTDAALKYAQNYYKTSPRLVRATIDNIKDKCGKQREHVRENFTEDLETFVEFWRTDGRFFAGG